jgi:hypothetical protein
MAWHLSGATGVGCEFATTMMAEHSRDVEMQRVYVFLGYRQVNAFASCQEFLGFDICAHCFSFPFPLHPYQPTSTPSMTREVPLSRRLPHASTDDDETTYSKDSKQICPMLASILSSGKVSKGWRDDAIISVSASQNPIDGKSGDYTL